jgi:hypothetical protein
MYPTKVKKIGHNKTKKTLREIHKLVFIPTVSPACAKMMDSKSRSCGILVYCERRRSDLRLLSVNIK